MASSSKILNGLKWSGISQIVIQVFTFSIGVVLARLLTPLDYGLLGMVFVFTGFAAIFVDMGLGSALIQKKNLEESHINTVFFMNMAAGTLLTLIMFLLAPFIAEFYSNPKLKLITQVLSLNFFLGSLSTVQRALISKSLAFKKLSQVDISTNLISGVISILMAYLGYGVWSLVFQNLLGRILSSIIIWKLSPWSPKPQFSQTAFKQLFGYSGNLIGFEMLNYWVRNLDNLLIGRYVGTGALGIYTRAYSLMLLPISQITSVISRVMFPALSALQDDLPKVKNIYLKTINIIAFVSFPMMIGLFVVADHFILAVYGSKWHSVVPILEMLCFVGLIQSVTTTIGWIFNSQGKTNVQFRWAIFSSIFRCTSFAIGIRWGVEGVAAVYLLGTLLLAVPSLMLAGRIIHLSLKEILSSLFPTFLIAALMGAAIYLLKILLNRYLENHLISLFALCLAGGVIYFLLATALKIKPYKEVKALFKKQKKQVKAVQI